MMFPEIIYVASNSLLDTGLTVSAGTDRTGAPSGVVLRSSGDGVGFLPEKRVDGVHVVVDFKGYAREASS